MTLPSEATLDRWFPYFFLLIVGLFAAQIALSVWRRRRAGLALKPAPSPDAIFVERRASGRYLATVWSRLGGASNCLLVYVTPTTLHVTLEFPFSILLPANPYGLEFSLPLNRITAVDTKSSLSGGELIIVHRFGDEPFEFRLKNPSKFRAALPTRL